MNSYHAAMLSAARERALNRTFTSRGIPSSMVRLALPLLLLLSATPILGAAAGLPSQKTAEATAPASDTFTSTQVAEQLLGRVTEGLQERNSRKMLAAFDREHMQGYLVFKDQVEAFFAQYGSFHVYVRLENASLQGDRGLVTAFLQLEGTPNYNGPEMHREAELTFELTRSQQGWKFTAVNPRDFFS